MRVVFVWDEPELTMLFTYALQKSGYDMVSECINDIEIGFKACVENPPDLLIVGRSLHEKDDGFELSQRLREVEGLPHFPIVAGYVDVWQKFEKAREKAEQAGVDLCFGRVYNAGAVIKQIRELLDNKPAPAVS